MIDLRKGLVFAAVVLAGVGSGAPSARAHGVVGDYVFLEPIITQDPTPANEFDILQPSWVKTREANNYSIGFDIEKVLWIDDNYMPRVSVRRRQRLEPYLALSGTQPAGIRRPYHVRQVRFLLFARA
jgi:hypothetical protein